MTELGFRFAEGREAMVAHDERSTTEKLVRTTEILRCFVVCLVGGCKGEKKKRSLSS